MRFRVRLTIIVLFFFLTHLSAHRQETLRSAELGAFRLEKGQTMRVLAVSFAPTITLW